MMRLVRGPGSYRSAGSISDSMLAAALLQPTLKRILTSSSAGPTFVNRIGSHSRTPPAKNGTTGGPKSDQTATLYVSAEWGPTLVATATSLMRVIPKYYVEQRGKQGRCCIIASAFACACHIIDSRRNDDLAGLGRGELHKYIVYRSRNSNSRIVIKSSIGS